MVDELFRFMGKSLLVFAIAITASSAVYWIQRSLTAAVYPASNHSDTQETPESNAQQPQKHPGKSVIFFLVMVTAAGLCVATTVMSKTPVLQVSALASSIPILIMAVAKPSPHAVLNLLGLLIILFGMLTVARKV